MSAKAAEKAVDQNVVPIDRKARLAENLHALVGANERLVVVSNRGPLTFKRSRSSGHWRVDRGSGGLVTALAEVGRLAPVTWISAAMDAADREASETLRGPANDKQSALLREIEQQMPGQDLRLDLRTVPADAWQGHYSKISNPFLWFMQHQLYTLAYEPTVDDELIDAWQRGYRVVNEAFAEAALEQTKGYSRPVVLLQDYHLYLAAAFIRAKRRDALLLHFNHIPWPAVDTWLVLPQGLRRAICEGCWRTTSSGCRPIATPRTFSIRSMRSCATRGWIRPAGTFAGAVARSGCAPIRSPSIPTRSRRLHEAQKWPSGARSCPSGWSAPARRS